MPDQEEKKEKRHIRLWY